ncbi:uncharacterized protein LOC127239985 [Andrographis paniculata]|uniref:uncharacterized protein LOC127239985 n=1 Tax=Andrographis paniculata TaxID=175694 RepID=UPI0021E72AA1|nr:uncharacterized protein LOC127239985 [Andrographis paniculata]
MARPVAFPLGFRISSRPIKMARQFHHASKPLDTTVVGRHLIFGSWRRISEQFQNSIGARSCFTNCSLITARSFSSSNSDRADGKSGKKILPWLKNSAERGRKRLGRNETTKTTGKSSWEESAEKFLNGGRRYESRGNELTKNDNHGVENDDDGDTEIVDDPRWHSIRNRINSFAETKSGGYERPEVRQWNNHENWGRKTWKEAKESTMPKMVGEGVYGVGPVLAALTAGRREFYAMYVQEGLDLSANNRKKKDKKGFDRILKMAERLEVNVKEISKHDLNMVVDNRPHQGVVLDASPLEMVGIKELEPAGEFESGSVWLALDEVTDPQNLGAIIRSAYFFGASGVVLCAKNSAPLSGVVSKASAGSLEVTEVRSCRNMMQFLTASAGNGWRVLGGSVSSRAVAVNEVVAGGAPTILVLGSEGTGLRPLVERACTQLVRIPGNIPADAVDDGGGGEVAGQEFRSFLAVESLNVSVAAGVLLSHLVWTKLGIEEVEN